MLNNSIIKKIKTQHLIKLIKKNLNKSCFLNKWDRIINTTNLIYTKDIRGCFNKLLNFKKFKIKSYIENIFYN